MYKAISEIGDVIGKVKSNRVEGIYRPSIGIFNKIEVKLYNSAILVHTLAIY